MNCVTPVFRERLYRSSFHKISDKTGVSMTELLHASQGCAVTDRTRRALCEYFHESWESLNGTPTEPAQPAYLLPRLSFWQRVDRFLSSGDWR